MHPLCSRAIDSICVTANVQTVFYEPLELALVHPQPKRDKQRPFTEAAPMGAKADSEIYRVRPTQPAAGGQKHVAHPSFSVWPVPLPLRAVS